MVMNNEYNQGNFYEDTDDDDDLVIYQIILKCDLMDRHSRTGATKASKKDHLHPTR